MSDFYRCRHCGECNSNDRFNHRYNPNRWMVSQCPTCSRSSSDDELDECQPETEDETHDNLDEDGA